MFPKAEWIGETKRVGPMRQIAVKPGEIVEVLKDNGISAWVKLPSGSTFGETESSNFKYLTSDKREG